MLTVNRLNRHSFCKANKGSIVFVCLFVCKVRVGINGLFEFHKPRFYIHTFRLVSAGRGSNKRVNRSYWTEHGQQGVGGRETESRPGERTINSPNPPIDCLLIGSPAGLCDGSLSSGWMRRRCTAARRIVTSPGGCAARAPGRRFLLPVARNGARTWRWRTRT